MRARRITLLVALLLLAVALVSASGSDDGPAVPGAERDPSRTPAATVEAELPAERPVRAAQGDVVRLEVAAAAPDEARVPRLGLRWPVGPGLQGTRTFVAERPGRFAVVLRTGDRIGTLVVER